MNYTIAQLKKILAKHVEWLADDSKGASANLSYANLRYANLRYADLSYADLSGASLSGASLSGADLRGASLRGASLCGASLSGADLRGANMDYTSGIPLWCGGGGAKFKCEAKLIQQVLAHLVTLDCNDAEWLELRGKILPFARKSHRAEALGLVKPKKG